MVYCLNTHKKYKCTKLKRGEWFLTLSKQHALKVLQNNVLRRTSAVKRNDRKMDKPA
jgi:hypothetical protein